mgnify:FL=1
MANPVYKILGQSAPASTANADLFTVASGRHNIVSTLVIANTTGTAATARVFARIGGATAATSNAVMYDVSIAANSTNSFTLGISMNATDILTVQTGTSNALTFTAFGVEI